MNLSQFKAACQAGITEDKILVVRCSLFNGEVIEKQIDLQPIIDRILHAIRHYHSTVLHGALNEDTISGITDWASAAVDAAKRIAHSKAAKEIYSVVASHQKEIATAAAMATLGPAGAAAVQTAYKAYDALKAAKAGDPVATEKIATVVKMAEEGHPGAVQCLGMMRSMNRMMQIKAKKDDTVVSGLGLISVKRPHHHHRRHRKIFHGPTTRNHRHEEEYPEEQMAGWLYNRPYRGALTATFQGSPGLGLTLRHLYDTGLGN